MGKVKYFAESFYCETCNKLEEKATCREFRQVRTEGKREVARRITHDAENGKGI